MDEGAIPHPLAEKINASMRTVIGRITLSGAWRVGRFFALHKEETRGFFPQIHALRQIKSL